MRFIASSPLQSFVFFQGPNVYVIELDIFSAVQSFFLLKVQNKSLNFVKHFSTLIWYLYTNIICYYCIYPVLIQTLDTQTSDSRKVERRTRTGVGLRQTSDQEDKRRTDTFIRKNVGLQLSFEKDCIVIRIK